jgi:hypothetical protein
MKPNEMRPSDVSVLVELLEECMGALKTFEDKPHPVKHTLLKEMKLLLTVELERVDKLLQKYPK